MVDFVALVTPPILAGPDMKPANGDIYIRSTNTVSKSGLVVVPFQAHGKIVDGTFKSLDGGPLMLVVTPEGVALEIHAEIVQESPGGSRSKYRISRTVSTPNQATVTWDALLDAVPVETGTEYAIPAWVTQLLADAQAAGPIAVDAAERAEAAAALIPTPAELDATYAAMTTLGITVPTGDTLTHAALQAAADAAVTNGTRVWAAGTLTTDQTLILKSDATLGGLTINYNGAGVAVQVGSGVSGELVSRKNISLPRVVNASKVAAGWLGATTGVKVINANTCVIDVPHVKNFVTGLHVTGLGQGAVHNTVTLGHLDNNKVNQFLDADSTGWSNQNLYLNGNLSHNSEEGSAVAGVRHLQIADGLVHDVNNNTWVNTSFEYVTPEFHLDLAGSANQFINCRWEAAGGVRVRWQSTSTGNQIMYGYGARLIVQTFVAGATRNHIYHENGGSRPSGGAVALENTSSSASPVEYVLDPGATAGAVNPATAYRAKRTADATHMKRATDAFDRVRFDHVNGRVYFGNGVADPTAYLGAIGTAFGLWGVATQTTAPVAGAAAALPATPAGYVTLYIAGVERKLPYY